MVHLVLESNSLKVERFYNMLCDSYAPLLQQVNHLVGISLRLIFDITLYYVGFIQ